MFFFLFYRHKRKVQNFCKTPTRGGHLPSAGGIGDHVTYEDPDAHLGNRPLVMRHHTMEVRFSHFSLSHNTHVFNLIIMNSKVTVVIVILCAVATATHFLL